MSVDHNPFSTSADSAPTSSQPSPQPPNPPLLEHPLPPDATNATDCNTPASDSLSLPQFVDPASPPDATNATECNIPATDPTDPNPVPPHRRGVYTFHPTPLNGRPNKPILADQESYEAPFRTNSALAAVPVRIPDLSDDQIRAIQLTLDGYTDGSIARILGINRSTLWRWKNFHPLFKSELSRRRHEAWSAAGDRFRRTLFAALKHIRRQLADKSALTSFRAAKLLLNLAGANRFAPPNEPTDPQSYLDAFALARRKEIHSPNLESDPAHDSERASALATLLAKCEDPDLPPSGMQPDPSQVHSLGNDDDPNHAQGSD